MPIRLAQPNDAAAIKALILAAGEFGRAADFDVEGWATFLAVTDVDPIRNRLGNPEYFTLLCHEGETLAGMITLRNFEKIDQLFVLPQFHRRGIARRLWREAQTLCLQNGNGGLFRVRSSTMAVPVYASFGFVATGPRDTQNGISYTPMELAL